MIELRRKLERGLRHPVLGPILLLLLALLLAMTVLHAVQWRHDAATELGAICFAILALLGPIVLQPIIGSAPVALVGSLRGRGLPDDRRRIPRGQPFATEPPVSALLH